jgi:hypothetical protein
MLTNGCLLLNLNALDDCTWMSKANKFISADHILGEVHQLPKGFRQQYYYIVLKYFIHGFQVYHFYFSRTNDQFSQYSPIRGIAVLSAGMI